MNTQSDQINELATSLAKAQGELEHAVKDSTNPHFKSKYADLASIWCACREPLSKHGLAVIQTLDLIEGEQTLVTTLVHSSGQWVKSIALLPVQKPGPQELVSCITYCRRASLAAIVGVYQDDDDAEVAEKSYRDQSYQQPSYQTKPKKQPEMQPAKAPTVQVNEEEIMEECIKIFSPKEHPDFPIEDFLAIAAKSRKLTISEIGKEALQDKDRFAQAYKKWADKKEDELLSQIKKPEVATTV